MTARATLTQAAIDRATKAAVMRGLKVKITAPDGTIFEFSPLLDEKPESAHPTPKKWRKG